MRITQKQSDANKTRVIAGASKLFREKGFEGVGVADLMRAAGLTHGGFYNHFASKDGLEAEACRQALATSVDRMSAVAEIEDKTARSAAMAAYRRNYVSKKARDAAAANCPMAAFAGEMPRQSEDVATAYATGLREYLDAFVAASAGAETARASAKRARQKALVEYSMLVGALILARSVAKADPELSDEWASQTPPQRNRC
jgi:TetR/AcrR family transcriptional regulator, transcriptional repressor for nem operon